MSAQDINLITTGKASDRDVNLEGSITPIKDLKISYSMEFSSNIKRD